jgi:hypothetical protein
VTSCTAINNCTNGNNNCAATATCQYTGPGTFSCSCNTGYNGTGTACTRKDFLSFFSFLFLLSFFFLSSSFLFFVFFLSPLFPTSHQTFFKTCKQSTIAPLAPILAMAMPHAPPLALGPSLVPANLDSMALESLVLVCLSVLFLLFSFFHSPFFFSSSSFLLPNFFSFHY